MANISFCGQTYLSLNPVAYEKVSSLKSGSYTNVHKNNGGELINHRANIINSNSENLIVIVRNRKNGFYRFVPINDEKAKRRVLMEIEDKTDKLCRTKDREPLTAWILGGPTLRSNSGSKVSSALNDIADVICDRPDIDTSILVGSKNGDEKFLIRAGVNDMRLALDRKPTSSDSIDAELEDIFDVVELNNTKFSYLA